MMKYISGFIEANLSQIPERADEDEDDGDHAKYADNRGGDDGVGDTGVVLWWARVDHGVFLRSG